MADGNTTAAPVATASPTTQPTTMPTTAPAPQAAPAAPVGTPVEAEIWRDKYNKRVRESVIEKRTLEARLNELTPKAQKLAELEKREALAKLNPPEYLKSIYGDGWYEAVIEAKLNGAPPANVVAAEIGKLREDFEAKLAARDEAAKTQAAAQSKAQLSQSLRQIQNDITGFFEASKAEFPALEARHGDASKAANAIMAHIKSVWDETAKFDESNQLVSQGRVVSYKEAAEALEKAEVEYTEKLAKHEKYAPKFREVLTPPKTSATISRSQQGQQSAQTNQQQAQQVRRTLSNDITGSTQGRQPPATLEERRQRAIAAFNGLHKR